MPVSLGLAVLRARLYDRAALIRRALIYGLLSVGLSLAYVAGMSVLPALFDRALAGGPRGKVPDNSLFLANLFAILTIAFLFQPLHHVLQRAIDRRVYRQMYETARRFAAFSTTVREETGVDSLSQQVIALLHATLRPHAAALWVRMHLLEETTALPGAPRQQDIALYRSPQTDGAGAERAMLALLPDDPLRTALVRAPWPVALAGVPASSLAASGLRAADTSSAVPLLDRGDLVGLIALSDHPCSFDLRELVAALGTELAPVLRVGGRWAATSMISSRSRTAGSG